MSLSREQIVNAGISYVNGLVPSYVSATTLSISAGSCRDNSNNIDMSYTAPTTVSVSFAGINGLDSGTVGANKVYAIYAITDITNDPLYAPAFVLSLNLNIPSLPYGYSVYRLVGFWVTNSASQFILGYVAGGASGKQFIYDAPQATTVTAGNVTTYTAINLSTLVPAVNNVSVSLMASFTPATAGNTLKLQPGTATGDAAVITGQVATVKVTQLARVLSRTITNVPTINYKVTAAGDAVAILVAGFDFVI